MHRLSEIKIINYRSCINATCRLADFTPLVGCNNVGKSNILSAVKWLLRPTSLSPADFYDKEQPVLVEGKIESVSDEILQGIDEKHRTKIEPYCADGTIRIRRKQAFPQASTKEIELYIFDPLSKIEEQSDPWRIAPTGIPQGLYALFPEPIEIGAMEDVAEDVAKFKTSTTIGKLIADIVKPIQEEHGEAIRKELDGLRNKLDADGKERPVQIKAFDNEANQALKSLFPDISVRLHIPTPEIDQLFKTGTIKAYEQDNIGRDITCLGHGAQRAIQMALVQCLSQKRVNTTNTSRMLLIVEEPELYMHPHGIEQVRVSLKKLSRAGYQVLVATHSPLFVESEDVPDTLIIRKTAENGTDATSSLRKAIQDVLHGHPSQARMLFSLSNSSKILFADRIVLAEGKTEHLLIPPLFAHIRNKTLGISRIALINQYGVDNTSNSMQILSALGVPCKAVVDLDYAFRGAVINGFIAADDLDIIECKRIIAERAAELNYNLTDDGLPQKGGSLSSTEAYADLARKEDAIDHIQSIYDKLLRKNIWIWKRGTFDEHVGIDYKSESSWKAFLEKLEKEEEFTDVLADAGGIMKFLEWIDE
ncbi:MAG: AAA family ATPase [Candidatus Krumholzibacteria bacterium]|nr:AAA family ATPase [Candidatus Krumholzibacteria bacterium]